MWQCAAFETGTNEWRRFGPLADQLRDGLVFHSTEALYFQPGNKLGFEVPGRWGKPSLNTSRIPRAPSLPRTAHSKQHRCGRLGQIREPMLPDDLRRPPQPIS